MANAYRDENSVPVLIAASSTDGFTPVRVYADPTTHRLLVDLAGGGSGTVTDVSVVSANGFAGTVATSTTTPAITLSTTVNAPVLAGNGTAIAGATTTGSGSTVVLNNSPVFVDDITVGTAGTATGSVLFKGTTSGTVTLSVADAAGTWTMKLPTTDGNNLEFLQTDGSGNTAWVAGTTVPATTVTVANEATDTSCFPLFVTAATGDLGPKSNAGLTFNSNTALLTATLLAGTTSVTSASILASSNDSGALGAAGTAFSDLFLAEGGVINWDSGDATITQTGNVLAVAGADFRVATADVGTNADSVPTLSSTSTMTNKTLTSPTLTTPSGFTTGGTITLAENTSIALDPAGSADGKYTGITVAGTAGATLAFGDCVYLAAGDSRWELADADSATTSDRMLGMVVLAAASDGDPTTILLQGIIRADAAFPALTIGSAAYVGETAGDIQVAIPTGADSVIRRVGYALTADELYFNPSMDSQITVA